MKENDIKNAGKALTITTVLTLFIATFEMVDAPLNLNLSLFIAGNLRKEFPAGAIVAVHG